MAAQDVFAIIGGGQAGAWAARTLRQHGFAGHIVLFAEEAHPPYERPPLSKQVLLGDAAPESTYVFAQKTYTELNVELRTGTRVAAIDPQAHTLELLDGSSFRYDKLLIATGAEPRRLDGARGTNVFYLRTLTDAAAIGEQLHQGARVLVIGGGWIGLEVAAAARKRGASVTVVEAALRLASRAAPEDLSADLLELHRTRGVDVRLSTYVTRFEGDARVQRAILSSGDVIDVSAVIVGIGVIPSTGLAQSGGLEIENGIAIDAHMQTSAADVFAAGDVASYIAADGARKRLESWDNAQKQGIAAGKAMLGMEVKLDRYPWFWSDQFDLNVQLVGDFTKYDERVALAMENASSRVTLYRHRGDIVGAVGVNAPREIRSIKRSLDNAQPLPEKMLAAVKASAQAVSA